MDLASIIGLIVCIGMVIFGIVTGPEGFPGLMNFIHAQSALITIGGMIGSVMIFTSIKDFVNALKAVKIAIKAPEVNEGEVINQIIDLSNVARKEGLLALEEAANNLEDEFMKKGILLVVDGTDPELVKSIMETEIACVDGRHKQVIGVYTNMAAMGPAWGMIGTLIGLINMLKQLDDIAAVGPNMSVALLTTLYGSMIANWLATPIAGKLKYNSDKEIMLKECMLEGLLSIQAGENPRIIEEKLKSFLSPEQRNEMGSNEDLGGE